MEGSNVTYLVALNNKLTGERGILGMIRLDAKTRERVKDASPNGIYGRAAFFPVSIASRAAEFREITGERESIVAAYGPELDGAK